MPGSPLVGPEPAFAGLGLNSKHKHILTLPAKAALFVWALLFAWAAWAQNTPDTNLWQSVEQGSLSRVQSEAWVRPSAFRSFDLQHSRLRPLLGRAPKESAQALASSGAVISLPMPDGTQARFRFVESPVMHPDLAARFPEIKTYLGRGIDDPAATVRFDLTPAGFHAQILSPRGAVYIEPYLRGNTNLHAVYARRDCRPAAPDFECRTDGDHGDGDRVLGAPQPVGSLVVPAATSAPIAWPAPRRRNTRRISAGRSRPAWRPLSRPLTG